MSERFSSPLRLKRIFFWTRLVCILVLGGFALRLLEWNRDVDPRFFRFLSTTPGKTLARVMNWPNLYDQTRVEKPLEEYSEEERYWRQEIESNLQSTWPTHTLEFRDGRVKNVQVLAFGNDQLHILENFGPKGRLETTIDRVNIRDIKPYETSIPEVTWRDVRFQMEYPTFELTHSGGYTVLTDAPYYQVSSSVQALKHLRSQYLDIFSPLVRFPKKEESLQLLFFTREKEYRRHQKNTAPLLENSIGYYSPLEDRMVLFNHQYSKRTQAVRQHVKEEVNELSRTTSSEKEQKRLRHLHQRLESHIRDQASMETLSTLRHEGAHYLSYTYGVHSWIHTENAWLIEGLAAYFESATPGASISSYNQSLWKMETQGRVPTLERLLSVRLPADFTSVMPEIKAHEAYALSWSLFLFCMQEPRREAFFAYLRYLQEPEDIPTLMETPRVLLLSNALSLTPDELEKDWKSSW